MLVRRWVCSVALLLNAVCVGFPLSSFAPHASFAQDAISPPAVEVPLSSDRQVLLEQGQALEDESRWSEALSHYEDCLREHPADEFLTQRRDLCRLHVELGRRYADESFRGDLVRLTPREALDLYSDILLKISSHYVETPDWQRLFEHSAAALDVALADPLFRERHLPRLPSAKVDHFRRALRQRLDNVNVTSRQAARQMAAYAARQAREQLGLSETAAILECACGSAAALDPYSTFLSPQQLDEVYAQIEGNFVGLGIELKAADGRLQILDVLPGSPAEKNGLSAGDSITAVDGQATTAASVDRAADLLQGEEGTWVDIEVVTIAGEVRQLRIRREEVEIPSVDRVQMLDEQAGVAYLRMTCFQKTTLRELDAALWKLHQQGMRSLVLDLRGNPGGLLSASVDVVDRFVREGAIVSTRGRNSQEDASYSAHETGTWDVPLVVLIDRDSASASEIFAGAIRDHHRGTLVGSRSYGKGSVQGIFPLSIAGAGLRLTTARFYSPDGIGFSQVGVEPDVLVQEALRPLDGGAPVAEDEEDDAVLQAALQAAREQLARR